MSNEEPTADAPDDYLRWLYTAARGGDHSAARGLLEAFVTEAPTGRIPAPVIAYLAMAFARYLGDDADLDHALLLAKPRGRQPQDGLTRAVSAVAFAYRLMRRDGIGKDAAKSKACGLYHVEPRTFERADHDNNLIRSMSDRDLDDLASVQIGTG